MRLTAAIALALLLLTGCGSEPEAQPATTTVDVASSEAELVERAWRDDLEVALGMANFDFDGFVDSAASDCDIDEPDQWAVEIALTGDVEGAEITRIGLSHACEENLLAFDAGLAQLDGVQDFAEFVCARPVASMTHGQKLIVRGACAG